MSTFELQVYKSGSWSVDSFFDDRDLALSEAERLTESAKYAGIRVMQEDYDDNSNKSNYRVVFSKMRQSYTGPDWRAKAASASKSPTRKASSRQNTRPRANRRVRPKRSNANLYIGLVVAFMVLIAGAAAMIGLQEIARYL